MKELKLDIKTCFECPFLRQEHYDAFDEHRYVCFHTKEYLGFIDGLNKYNGTIPCRCPLPEKGIDETVL